MSGGGASFYQELRQVPCGYCLAPAGDPCRTRSGRVLGDGYEHLVRVQAWHERWLAEYLRQHPRPDPQIWEPVTVSDVAAGMRNRPGFAEEEAS